jgi:hypothetical protein
VPRTLPQLLARRVVIRRHCLGSALVARKASEADVIVQDLECFCETGVRVGCVVSSSLDPEPPGVVVVLSSALATTQESEHAASRQSIFVAVGFDCIFQLGWPVEQSHGAGLGGKESVRGCWSTMYLLDWSVEGFVAPEVS